MSRRRSLAPLGFLLPNLLGFLVFTLFPVFFSLWMAFTNWTLKPAVRFEVVGLRNFADLMGVRAPDGGRPELLAGWAACAVAAAACLVLALLAARRGRRRAGAVCVLVGGAALAGLVLLSGAVWRAYEPTDARFWQYFANTLFLMLGLPFSIAGSLALALLLNEELPVGPARTRLVGALVCGVGAAVTALVTSAAGRPDAGLIGACLWGIAGLGIGFNVVTFRTLFYLPTFTAGVALMILWKALYNPETGPVNVGLGALFHFLGLHPALPKWLADVTWAKPALIIMGIWTGIGGTNMLLYLAGLSNVPRELIDAAAVDGASAWHRFRHVIWPQLAPTTFFISIMAVIGGLQGGFEQARVMTGGGPAGSTTTLSYYIYNKAFQDLDLGYAAAISWVLFAIVFVATALNWKFGKGLEVDL